MTGNTLVRRVLKVLSTPLWVEAESFTRQRRCQTLIALPFAALAGLAWGILAAPDMGVPPLIGTLVGLVSFALFVHVQFKLEPVAMWWLTGERDHEGLVLPFIWDMLVGGALAFLLTQQLGAPTFSGVAAAGGFGAAYALLTGHVFCGNLLGRTVGAFLGHHGKGTPHRHEHSRASALAAHGEYAAAVVEYRMSIDEDPTDATLYFRLGALLSERLERHEEAVAVLRRGMREPSRATPAEHAQLVRRVLEICEHKLGDAGRARPDLRRLVERQPGTDAAAWARRELDYLSRGRRSHPEAG